MKKGALKIQHFLDSLFKFWQQRVSVCLQLGIKQQTRNLDAYSSGQQNCFNPLA